MRILVVLGLALLISLGAAPRFEARSQASDAFVSARVAEIRVEGNERIEAETVRSYMTIHVGDPFDPRALDHSLKSLFGTGLFADVAFRQEGNVLVVRVVENPVINRLSFEGNRAIGDDQLEAEVQLQPRMVYTRTRVQSDTQRLIDIYRRSGRFAATVEPKVIQLPENRVDLVFEIDEGPVTGVEKIAFVGNKKFSDGELQDSIQTKESAWWRFLTRDDTYDPDRLTFDQELLRRFYLASGYADFRVVSAVAELTEDRKNFFITFTVEEGERYRVGNVDVESKLPELDGKELLSLVKTYKDEWYNADKVEETIQKLTDAVGNRGYAFVDIHPVVERDREELTIDVTYDIAEGPRVYVQRIDIAGNARTLDKVIRREFRLAEGDAFNTARYRRSQQRIRNLGFFADVRMETLPGDAPDQTVIKVEVEEQATGQLNLGGGFSTFEGLLANFGIQENNLLGRGQRVRLNGTVSARRLLVDLSFTEPYFLNRDLSAGVDAFRRETDFRRESSFDQEELGFGLRAGYSITEELRHSLSYTIRRDEITNVDDTASFFVREQEGSFVKSIIGQQLFLDRRDSRISPTEGYAIRLSQDLAGLGGDDRFLRHEVMTEYHYPFAEGWVGTFSLEGGAIVGLGRDVRITDRFFVGGNRIRGFDFSGIGPRDIDTRDALGGDFFYVASLQLTIPLGLPQELPIKGRVFTDIGTLTGIDDEGREIFDKATPRVGVGIGFSYESPFGPVGIDLAQPVVKENVDETEVFRINFGTRF